VFENYHKTNRFIIESDVRFYNYILKHVSKKYYVSNVKGKQILSFFKRNNKVILNMFRLEEYEQEFMYHDEFLIDVLSNLEVMIVSKKYYIDKKDVLITWPGNLIISNGSDI